MSTTPFGSPVLPDVYDQRNGIGTARQIDRRLIYFYICDAHHRIKGSHQRRKRPGQSLPFRHGVLQTPLGCIFRCRSKSTGQYA
ncbi:hypothetical protein [Pseudaminobacter soli (ex Li et al. 2025)]|uniref:hypothetical protein n=1 Tax=Pseudaminobacter soli (ex Li et al. 2025) TaxID=1295366 RepID=UPI001FE1D820|nr:hypothetical protein [Mesorhizobium soli]